MKDLTGQQLLNYQVFERLGSGGMAVVYRAVQQPLGREVALKALLPALVETAGFIERFENEARTLARLDHPNILPIYDFEQTTDVVFLTMPLVRGGTLRDLLRRGVLDSVTAWQYLRQIGEALHYAHEAGIIHRDLKPANVLIHTDGRGLLADFGLARSSGQPLDLTAAGFSVGTPGYMAPEQVMGQPFDRRADIYSLGVMTFEMLTGRLPFDGATPMEIAFATVHAPIPSACALNPVLPDELDRLLQKVLAKDPAERPPTAAILVAELARLPQRRVAGAPTPPVPPAPPPPAPPREPALLTPPPPSQAAPPAGSAVLLLEQLGLRRLRPRGRFLLDSYYANTVQVAREVCGERWPEVALAAGLPELSEVDPAGGPQRSTPIENPSRLVQGFDLVYTLHAPDRIREWGRKATDRWLPTRKKQRRVLGLLEAFTGWMDEVRGEPAHVCRQMDPKQYWLVHYANLFVVGRRQPEKACFIWTATYETLLRWAGLANDWYVEEIECGSVTGTYDCVFAVRSVRSEGR